LALNNNHLPNQLIGNDVDVHKLICGEFFVGVAFCGFLLTSKITKIKTPQIIILLQFSVIAWG
jgi:hypothetical protein